jgi:tetratricopeptide (TPR) repeat protein
LTKTALGLALMITLAACGNTGGFGGVSNLLGGPSISTGDKTFAPGVDGARGGIDGLMVGHRLMASGEYELALKAYLRAASQQGANVDVLSALGSANLALGRLGQAEQILRRAIEQDPSFVPAQNNLGVVLMEAGKVGDARVVFQRAFALDSGKTDEIRENLKQAIAASEKTVYTEDEVAQKAPMALVRRGQGNYVLLSQF